MTSTHNVKMILALDKYKMMSTRCTKNHLPLAGIEEYLNDTPHNNWNLIFEEMFIYYLFFIYLFHKY